METLGLDDPNTWVSFLTLAALEIVLGIDNIVFIAIMTARVEPAKRALTYRLGLGAALITRLLLLGALSWVLGLTAPLFRVVGHDVTGRALILLGGGLFLMGKATHEMYDQVEGHSGADAVRRPPAPMLSIVLQIMVIDIVFSLDSVITAVGMADQLWVMAAAMVTAVIAMLVFAQRIGEFVNRHPSLRVLALAFLLLIGVLLTAEGLGQHIDKGYIYFAMGFSLLVELVNMRLRKSAPG